MTFDEFISALKDLGFELPSKIQGTWYIDSTQLKYIKGAKSSCDVFGFFLGSRWWVFSNIIA